MIKLLKLTLNIDHSFNLDMKKLSRVFFSYFLFIFLFSFVNTILYNSSLMNFISFFPFFSLNTFKF